MNPFEGYRITSPYGMRKDPFDGSQKMHTGIDLVIADKAPLKAFMAGKVVHAKMGAAGSGLGGFGIVVAIRDLNGAIHMYAHLDSAAVIVGQEVKAGQVVGKQGNTGHSAGSHLHYEVRLGSAPSFGFGTHTDPTAYLKKYIEAEEDEAEMNDQIAALTKRVENLEVKTKVLNKTPAPAWFLTEFGVNVLDGIVSDLTGDTDFWRDTAVTLRFRKQEKK